MNDVNHYGLLFQYDKHWQRSRTKKANILKSLDTPREFRSYFEGEVDTITTSLGRLTELLDLAGPEKKENCRDNEQFKQQFGTLIRSVQSLSESLKLYNEGLVTENTCSLILYFTIGRFKKFAIYISKHVDYRNFLKLE